MQPKGSLKKSTLMVLAACVLGGCVAKTDNPDVQNSHSSVNANSSSGSSPVVCGDDQAGLPNTPLRRLTRFEYHNSVRDLLNVNTDAVYELPADVNDGFDNNAALQVASEFLIEKYIVVSEVLAAQAVKNVSAIANCNVAIQGEEACAKAFARSFGRRAYRRPITAEDEALFMAAYQIGVDGGGHTEGIELMIRMALQSPHFLYRLEFGQGASAGQKIPVRGFEMATRLAYFLWGSGPDDSLLDAAAAGQLEQKEQIAEKASQMLASPKARVSLNNFLAQWSGVNALDTLTKNTALFPNYSDELRKAMQRELPAFVDDMFAANNVTLNNLFTANFAYVSGPLADIYGVPAPAGSQTTPKKVSLPFDHERAGLLTQAGFLAVQGHPDQTSPVLRGKFVRANLLCTPPPPPPDNIDISVPELTAGTTARDRAAVHLSAGETCSICHTLMDPIGLAFENFDALGQHQLYEGGSTIDVSGEILHTSDPALIGSFKGVRELGQKLANSEVVENCVATQMFRFAAGRYHAVGDSCSMNNIQTVFSSAGGDLVALMVAMTQTDAFLYRTVEAQ